MEPNCVGMTGKGDFLKISHVKKSAFLAAFSRCGSLSKAAKRAKVDRRTHYNWLKDDASYSRAFQQAVIEAGDSLQDRLAEMAFEGNVTAAIFLLKGLKPQQFRDRVEIKNIKDLNPEDLTPAVLEAITHHLIKEASGGDPVIEAEIHRQAQLQAGITVVDATAEVVEGPKPE
jgi:hypothetical protein